MEEIRRLGISTGTAWPGRISALHILPMNPSTIILRMPHRGTRPLGKVLFTFTALFVLLLQAQTSLAVTFTLNKSTYAPNENIGASWTRTKNDPKSRTDWIGLYTPSQVPGSSASLRWLYLNGSQTAPNKAIQSGNVTFASPGLGAGSYVARFFANDSYTELAPPVPFTITNAPPAFVVGSFSLRYAVTGSAYSGMIRGYARDPDPSDVLTFSKISGPVWLSIASNGAISGTATTSNLGDNIFTVRVADPLNQSATATFTVPVFTSSTAQVDSLRVLSYNLWHGWSSVNNGQRKGFDSVILSGADIVCTQESTGDVSGSSKFQPEEVAREIGWYYCKIPSSGDVGVVSRYPIVSQETVANGVGLGARVRLTDNPVREVMVYSLHLDYLNYGPYEAERNGSTNASVLQVELSSQRDEQATAFISNVQNPLSAADQTPVIVCGDFNCPSHQDWTQAASSLHYGKVVAWPVTVTLTNAGLVDSFRPLNTDPFDVPGTTWSSIYVGTEPQDRIDYVFYKGLKLTPVTSNVFNTQVEVTLNRWGDNTSPVASNTWPSDHRATLTEFDVAP
jgi:endonuclease/exonuclease/phosphatase family metal-dependent hydrolase